jgi:hypothetical protein
MEHLFAKVRDMTLAKHVSEADAQRLRHLVDGLRGPQPGDRGARTARALRDLDAGASADCPARPAPPPQTGRGAGKLEARDTDSEALQHELQSAKQLLQKRIAKRTWKQ